MKGSWVCIYDNSSRAKCIFASPSLTEITQFDLTEVVGEETGYFLFHPDDNPQVKKVHACNVYNERLSSMTTFRHLREDGSDFLFDCVIFYCYELVLSCNYIHDPDSIEHKLRKSAVDEYYYCHPGGTLDKNPAWNVHKIPRINKDALWANDRLNIAPEKRVCIMLNRFTDHLSVLYLSNLANELFGMDEETSIGRSVFDHLSDLDGASLQIQVDLAKKYDMMFKIRFDWITNLKTRTTVKAEGVVCSVSDLILMVVRHSPTLQLELGPKPLE